MCLKAKENEETIICINTIHYILGHFYDTEADSEADKHTIKHA